MSGAGCEPKAHEQCPHLVKSQGLLLGHSDLGNHLQQAVTQHFFAVGENAGCMTLKGASPVYQGDPVADQWPLDEQLQQLAARWEIDPDKQLRLLEA